MTIIPADIVHIGTYVQSWRLHKPANLIMEVLCWRIMCDLCNNAYDPAVIN